MNGELHGPMNGGMIATNGASRILWGGLVISSLCLSAAACLTPGQTESVGRQLGEIRQQAEQVRSAQQRNVESIDTMAPAERQAASVRIEESPEPRAVRAPQAAGMVTASDQQRDPELAGASGASSDEDLFRQGYALYHRRDYQGAEQHMRRFLNANPDSPMADDALFWIAECRFARGLYRDAIFEYRDVIDRHPGSQQVPRAWYMIALSYERLGEPAAMNEHLAIVVEKFPQSDVAPLARDRLGTL